MSFEDQNRDLTQIFMTSEKVEVQNHQNLQAVEGKPPNIVNG